MYEDPIVEEVHRIREAYAASMGHDLKKMLEDIRSRQGKDGRKVVSRAATTMQAVLPDLIADTATPPSTTSRSP